MTSAPQDSSGAPQRPPAASPGNQDSAETTHSRRGPLMIAGIVISLIVLHQDNWFWNSKYLVFGILPIALFYHACISIAASCTWLLATKIAWPIETIQIAKVAEPTITKSEEAH